MDEEKITVRFLKIMPYESFGNCVAVINFVTEDSNDGQVDSYGPVIEIPSFKTEYWDYDAEQFKESHPKHVEYNQIIMSRREMMMRAIYWGYPQTKNSIMDDYRRQERYDNISNGLYITREIRISKGTEYGPDNNDNKDQEANSKLRRRLATEQNPKPVRNQDDHNQFSGSFDINAF